MVGQQNADITDTMVAPMCTPYVLESQKLFAMATSLSCRVSAAKGRCHGKQFLAFYIRGAHWRHLGNTTEPSVCCGDAALCQITLTTC